MTQQAAVEAVQKQDVWEKLVDKTIESGGNLFDMAGKFLKEVIDKYGDMAVDTVFMVIRIDALATLVPAFLAFSIFGFIAVKCYKSAKLAFDTNDMYGLEEYGRKVVYVPTDGSKATYLESTYAIPGFIERHGADPKNFIRFRIPIADAIVGVFSAIFSVIGFMFLLNVWKWVAVFSPQIWVVHQIVERVVK